MPETPRASIVMVAWGKRPVTESTLETLERALGPKLHTEFELVLVDNASPDDTLELFAVWERKGATVVRLPENRNFAGGCNAGAEVARGAVLLFLNNDMVFFPGVLEELVETALEPDVGMVGARLLFPDGAMQHAGVVWRTFDRTPTPVHIFHFDAGDLPHGRAVLDLDAVTGACAVMRREVFFDVGGFDTLFVNGLEDVDLCVKVRLKGLRIVLRGDLSLVHLESATRRGQAAVAQENIRKFNERYAGAFDDDAELLRELYDARLSEGGFVHASYLHAEGAPVTLDATLGGLAGESAEARALLAALEQGGLRPAVRDHQPVWVTPRFTAEERRLLETVRERVSSPFGLTVQVPVGRFAILHGGEGAVARLAQMPGRRLALGRQGAWAATPWLAEALVAAGLPERRVAYLPPPIPIVAAGRGGAGVLVLLGGHDLPAAAATLSALRGLAAPVRVLPLVRTARLAQVVAESAPGAELLPPLTPEAEIAALGAQADVVVAADDTDPFDRRVLLCAAAGATPLTVTRGAAAAVLGGEIVAPEVGRATVEAALEGAAERRGAHATRVRDVCAPGAIATRAAELVTAAARWLDDDELAELLASTASPAEPRRQA